MEKLSKQNLLAHSKMKWLLWIISLGFLVSKKHVLAGDDHIASTYSASKAYGDACRLLSVRPCVIADGEGAVLVHSLKQLISRNNVLSSGTFTAALIEKYLTQFAVSVVTALCNQKCALSQHAASISTFNRITEGTSNASTLLRVLLIQSNGASSAASAVEAEDLPNASEVDEFYARLGELFPFLFEPVPWHLEAFQRLFNLQQPLGTELFLDSELFGNFLNFVLPISSYQLQDKDVEQIFSSPKISSVFASPASFFICLAKIKELGGNIDKIVVEINVFLRAKFNADLLQSHVSNFLARKMLGPVGGVNRRRSQPAASRSTLDALTGDFLAIVFVNEPLCNATSLLEPDGFFHVLEAIKAFSSYFLKSISPDPVEAFTALTNFLFVASSADVPLVSPAPAMWFWNFFNRAVVKESAAEQERFISVFTQDVFYVQGLAIYQRFSVSSPQNALLNTMYNSLLMTRLHLYLCFNYIFTIHHLLELPFCAQYFALMKELQSFISSQTENGGSKESPEQILMAIIQIYFDPSLLAFHYTTCIYNCDQRQNPYSPEILEFYLRAIDRPAEFRDGFLLPDWPRYFKILHIALHNQITDFASAKKAGQTKETFLVFLRRILTTLRHSPKHRLVVKLQNTALLNYSESRMSPALYSFAHCIVLLFSKQRPYLYYSSKSQQHKDLGDAEAPFLAHTKFKGDFPLFYGRPPPLAGSHPLPSARPDCCIGHFTHTLHSHLQQWPAGWGSSTPPIPMHRWAESSTAFESMFFTSELAHENFFTKISNPLICQLYHLVVNKKLLSIAVNPAGSFEFWHVFQQLHSWRVFEAQAFVNALLNDLCEINQAYFDLIPDELDRDYFNPVALQTFLRIASKLRRFFVDSARFLSTSSSGHLKFLFYDFSVIQRQNLQSYLDAELAKNPSSPAKLPSAQIFTVILAGIEGFDQNIYSRCHHAPDPDYLWLTCQIQANFGLKESFPLFQFVSVMLPSLLLAPFVPYFVNAGLLFAAQGLFRAADFEKYCYFVFLMDTYAFSYDDTWSSSTKKQNVIYFTSSYLTLTDFRHSITLFDRILMMRNRSPWCFTRSQYRFLKLGFCANYRLIDQFLTEVVRMVSLDGIAELPDNEILRRFAYILKDFAASIVNALVNAGAQLPPDQQPKIYSLFESHVFPVRFSYTSFHVVVPTSFGSHHGGSSVDLSVFLPAPSASASAHAFRFPVAPLCMDFGKRKPVFHKRLAHESDVLVDVFNGIVAYFANRRPGLRPVFGTPIAFPHVQPPSRTVTSFTTFDSPEFKSSFDPFSSQSADQQADAKQVFYGCDHLYSFENLYFSNDQDDSFVTPSQ